MKNLLLSYHTVLADISLTVDNLNEVTVRPAAVQTIGVFVDAMLSR